MPKRERTDILGGNTGHLLFHGHGLRAYPIDKTTGRAPRAYRRAVERNPKSLSLLYSVQKLRTGTRIHHQIGVDVLNFPALREGLFRKPYSPREVFSAFPQVLRKVADTHNISEKSISRVGIFPSWLFYHPTGYAALERYARSAGFSLHAAEPDAKLPRNEIEYASLLSKDFSRFGARFRAAWKGERVEGIKRADLKRLNRIGEILSPAFRVHRLDQRAIYIRRALSEVSRLGGERFLYQIFPRMFIGFELRRK